MDYCAGVVFRTADGEVLLLKNARRGRWEFPGGRRDKRDADLWGTARRETREETGYVLPREEPVLDEQFIAIDPGFRYKTFLFRLPRRFNPELSHEHSEYCWAAPASALAYYDLHPGVRMVLAELT